ncbi:hypothetical protein ACUUL3_07170 [Thiovibrio sp. JS02]
MKQEWMEKIEEKGNYDGREECGGNWRGHMGQAAADNEWICLARAYCSPFWGANVEKLDVRPCKNGVRISLIPEVETDECVQKKFFRAGFEEVANFLAGLNDAEFMGGPTHIYHHFLFPELSRREKIPCGVQAPPPSRGEGNHTNSANRMEGKMEKSKFKENLCFFAWPAVMSGYIIAASAGLNFLIRVVSGREASPIYYFFWMVGGVALSWAGWRGWKRAKQLDLLDPKSEFLGLPLVSLLGRKNFYQFSMVFSCLLFSFGWMRPGGPGPVISLLAACLVAVFTRKYLVAKAELEFARAKEEGLAA